MQEEAPTRPVRYIAPDGTIAYVSQKQKWVNPRNKTMEQTLLEIGKTIYECQRRKQDIGDSLEQASDILWREIRDPNNKLTRFVKEQQERLTAYERLRSQAAKDNLLEDVAKETQFRIEHYFRMGSDY